jgi:hypothetical protein
MIKVFYIDKMIVILLTIPYHLQYETKLLIQELRALYGRLGEENLEELLIFQVEENRMQVSINKKLILLNPVVYQNTLNTIYSFLKGNTEFACEKTKGFYSFLCSKYKRLLAIN